MNGGIGNARPCGGKGKLLQNQNGAREYIGEIKGGKPETQIERIGHPMILIARVESRRQVVVSARARTKDGVRTKDMPARSEATFFDTAKRWLLL